MLNFSFGFGYFPKLSVTTLVPSRESRVISVSLYPVFPTHITVEWTIPARFGSCTFNVYKSKSEKDSWEKINPLPITSNHLRVPLTADNSKFSSYFYLVEVIKPDGSRLRSLPTDIQNKAIPWVYLRAKEIRRREWLVLRKFSGAKTIVYKRKTFGKRCPECWDPVSEKVTKDRCPTCLGTSFEGGYFPGYLTLMDYEPTPNNSELGYQGRIEPNSIPAWTIDIPKISTFDIILRVPDWKIYRVNSLQATELQLVPVRQLLILTELDKDSIEFKLADREIPEGYI